MPDTYPAPSEFCCHQHTCPGTPPEAQQRIAREARQAQQGSVAPLLGPIPSDVSGSDYEFVVGGVEFTLRFPKDGDSPRKRQRRS